MLSSKPICQGGVLLLATCHHIPKKGGDIMVGIAKRIQKKTILSRAAKSLLPPSPSRSCYQTTGLGIGPARCAKIHRKSLAKLNFAKLTNMRATPNLRVIRLPATLQMIAWKQAAFPKKNENRRWISSWPHFEAAVQLSCFGLLKIISKEVHFRERACLPSN